MANSYTTQPMVFDTDITSYRTAANAANGVRVEKLALVVATGGAATAGVVTITLPSARGGSALYFPILVGTQAANTTILNDNPSGQSILTWTDFAITGLTASGTKLYIWTTF
jgi:hypothetical protein